MFVGLATGLPVMIVVGPIALLLVQEGMERGLRGGVPAIVGVSMVDLTFSATAALAGAGALRLLEPLSGWLEITATAVLALMAVGIWRTARSDLRTVGAELAPSRPEVVHEVERAALGGGGVATVTLGAPAPVPSPAVATKRMARFFAATAINPITIVVFTSLVISGRDGVGTPGWVVGMTIASLLVGTTFVGIGHGLGTLLNAAATARLRMGGAVLIAAMALWFAFA